MISITAKNINEAFYQGMTFFLQEVMSCQLVTTRGQRRIMAPTIWVTEYLSPTERVLFHPVRDANPFFHLMDGLYMLSGRADVKWLYRWLPRVAEYSDDGFGFYGAYGMRMRIGDQLYEAVQRLRRDKHSSRAVIALYFHTDSQYQGKDLPCNCTIFLDIKHGRLHMTVANRSNDMLWGAYGSNVVQFSMLMEFIAAQLGCELGVYTQFSHNTHVYPDSEVWLRLFESTPMTPEQYDFYHPDHTNRVEPYPLVDKPAYFLSELTQFMKDTDSDTPMPNEDKPYRNSFFTQIAWPMVGAYKAHRAGDRQLRDEALAAMPENNDWRLAAEQWCQRRDAARATPKTLIARA